MTTLVTPSQLSSAIASIVSAKGAGITGTPRTWAELAQSALSLAAGRWAGRNPNLTDLLTAANAITAAATALTADATALTTAAASLSGSAQTAATAAATAATAAATAATASATQATTQIAVVYPLQGEVASAVGYLNQVAAQLPAGGALTAIQSALSTLSGTYS